MKELVKHIVTAVVSDKDAVEVREIEGRGYRTIEVRVSKLDVGKVIGRSGRTVGAIRTIVSCAVNSSHEKYNIEVIDEGNMS
jgi:predicted RNA-binding protein YlqC (UPF0109 family)